MFQLSHACRADRANRFPEADDVLDVLRGQPNGTHLNTLQELSVIDLLLKRRKTCESLAPFVCDRSFHMLVIFIV